jgi:hypothetical protein
VRFVPETVLFLRLRFPYAGNQIVERECVLSSRVRVRLPLVCAGNRIVGRGCLLLPGCDSGFREFVPETELSSGNGCFFPGAPTPVSVSLCRKANSRREWVVGMVPRVPSRLPLIIRGRWLGMVRFFLLFRVRPRVPYWCRNRGCRNGMCARVCAECESW